MKNKHTPGPWIYDETWALIHDGRKSAVSPHESAAEICAIHAARNGKPDECKANALLIAAAPELLEALQGIIDLNKYSNSPCPFGRDIERICRTAIAKATGQQ